MQLGIAAAEIERVEASRQLSIVKGAEGYDLGALIAQQVEIVFVVERERVVASYTNPYRAARIEGAGKLRCRSRPH